MGRTLKHARRVLAENRQPPPATYRGRGAATTDDRDTDRRGDDACNTSDERRPKEGLQDRPEQARGQAEVHDENEDTNAVAVGGAGERQRHRNGSEVDDREAGRLCSQRQT